jgi:hypothetical protein
MIFTKNGGFCYFPDFRCICRGEPTSSDSERNNRLTCDGYDPIQRNLQRNWGQWRLRSSAWLTRVSWMKNIPIRTRLAYVGFLKFQPPDNMIIRGRYLTDVDQNYYYYLFILSLTSLFFTGNYLYMDLNHLRSSDN